MTVDKYMLDGVSLPRVRKFARAKCVALAFVVITNAYASVIAIDPTQQNNVHFRAKIPFPTTTLFTPCFISSFRTGDLPRRESLLCSQPEITVKDSEVIMETEKDYFISDAQFVHLGPAARILTEEFYSQKTNFVTFQIEKLKTSLSLESTFPNQQNLSGSKFSRQPLQKMIVACNAKNGQVIGFAEVDARPLGNTQSSGTIIDAAALAEASNNILRSYMYNLAVDKKWKRKGIASELVRACELFVSDQHDSCIEKRLYLRVRKCNEAAVGLYQRLGYEEMDPAAISLSKEDINSGSLEDGELILFAKDLPVPPECEIE